MEIFIFIILLLHAVVIIEAKTNNKDARLNTVMCRQCGRELTDPDLLRVSPLSPFVLEKQNMTMFGSSLFVPVERLRNPAGVEFSVISFTRAGCRGVGAWTSDHTWYPGYHWRVCVCPQCGAHLGWMFEPEDSDLINLEKPSSSGFYALIVSKIIDEHFASSITISSHAKDQGQY